MAYLINSNDYYKKIQPAKSEELLNVIEVAHYPLNKMDFNDEYYKTMDPILLPYLSTATIECKYSEPPCLDPLAIGYETGSDGELFYDDNDGSIINNVLTTLSVDYYAWGCIIQVRNDNPFVSTTTSTTEEPQRGSVPGQGYCVVVVDAYPLKSQGEEYYSTSDTTSILENGVLKYQYPKNHLIQKRASAIPIATTLLAAYVEPRKDISVDWRGDPSLELRDNVDIPTYDKNGIYTVDTFKLYKNVIDYNGTLRMKIDGRKLNTTTTTTTTTAAP